MNTAERLREIISHLSCGIRQSLPSDDQIIIGHMRDALREASEALDAIKHDPNVETISTQFWSHYCVPNRNTIETECGQPCNWCDVNERTAMPLVSLPTPDRVWHRAYAENGSPQDLADYIKLYGGEK